MEDINQSEESVEKAKKKLKVSLRWFFSSIWELIVDTFSVKQGADIEGTIESIKKDVEFKGHNVWILFLSIIIASIGLNTNSVAIIIGAMLISPLMGPILGIGYGLGTNDIKTLLISIKNLTIAVVISLFTSFLYFKLSPFVNEQPEILARTKPHLLDVLISIFGGLAGIIANSRKERTNVIPGVAIATALMPPLCTAGFGLSTGNYEYFMGAFYLFLLNAAGISVTTLLVVKYMKFPRVHYIDPVKEKKVKWFVAIAWVLLIVPSFNMFYKVLTQEFFKRKVNEFVVKELVFEKSYLVKNEFKFNKDSISIIDAYFYGEIIDSNMINSLNNKLLDYELNNTVLMLHQDKNNSKEFQDRLENVTSSYDFLFDKTSLEIEFQNAKIAELQQLVEAKNGEIDLSIINKEMKVLFPEVTNIGYSEMDFVSNNDSLNIIPTFIVEASTSKIDNNKIEKWLKLMSHSDSCLVIIRSL